MLESLTVTLSKGNYSGAQQPNIPKLWEVVNFTGRIGIVYRIQKIVDEDGPANKLSIKNWTIYKQPWRNNLNLWWLKLRVKLNWI